MRRRVALQLLPHACCLQLCRPKAGLLWLLTGTEGFACWPAQMPADAANLFSAYRQLFLSKAKWAHINQLWLGAAFSFDSRTLLQSIGGHYRSHGSLQPARFW